MKDILEEIIAWKRIEVEQMKGAKSERTIHQEVEKLLDDKVASLKTSIKNTSTGIIAEFKRKSPSKGWIKEDGKPEEIPLSYQQNGATGISILTDYRYFGGSDEFIQIARNSGVTLPILYKNFIIDEYQLFQARFCGASAVLLIAACLKKDEYKILLHTAHELGLEVLLEMHNQSELEYADNEPDLWGINNRNLGTFITDVQNSFDLAPMMPQDAIKVSESGISNFETVKALKLAGYKGFLIGENFMKTNQPGEALKQFIKEV